MSADAAPSLLAVPNVSVGPGRGGLALLEEAFGSSAALLDVHSDATHNRSVFTISAPPSELGGSLLAGAGAAIELIDLADHAGAHPRIGALDVAPVVYAEPDRADAARVLAGDLAGGLADLGLPVFLYGELAASEERRERHFFRRGGVEALAERMRSGELLPDLGPAIPHPSAGAVLVTARPPLAAFNVELADVSSRGASEIAAALREAGGGLPGVRAIVIELERGRVQISTNVHDPVAVTLGAVVAEIQRLAVPLGGHAVAAELVGLVPEAALSGYPADVPIRGFDPAGGTIEARMRTLGIA